jgi:hypothetical protein
VPEPPAIAENQFTKRNIRELHNGHCDCSPTHGRKILSVGKGKGEFVSKPQDLVKLMNHVELKALERVLDEMELTKCFSRVDEIKVELRVEMETVTRLETHLGELQLLAEYDCSIERIDSLQEELREIIEMLRSLGHIPRLH